MTVKCAACGSDQLLRRVTLLKAGIAPGEIVLDIPPANVLGMGHFGGELRAVTCVACGHVQIHATDLDALRAAYEHQQASALHLT